MLITVTSITGHRSTLMVRLQLRFRLTGNDDGVRGFWLVGDVIICGNMGSEDTELDVDRWMGPIRVRDPASYGKTGRTLCEEVLADRLSMDQQRINKSNQWRVRSARGKPR
jgi:hypothetical protein